MCAYSLAIKAPAACLAANARGRTPVDAAVACEQGEARSPRAPVVSTREPPHPAQPPARPGAALEKRGRVRRLSGRAARAQVLNAMLLACAGDGGGEAVAALGVLLDAGAVADTWAPNGSSVRARPAAPVRAGGCAAPGAQGPRRSAVRARSEARAWARLRISGAGALARGRAGAAAKAGRPGGRSGGAQALMLAASVDCVRAVDILLEKGATLELQARRPPGAAQARLGRVGLGIPYHAGRRMRRGVRERRGARRTRWAARR
jgi:hypothetical protein